MFGLREQVGCHKRRVAGFIGNHQHFTWTGWHIDGHPIELCRPLGGHHILVAGAKDLVHLGNALRAEGHGADGLYAPDSEDAGDTGHLGGIENGGMNLSLLIGWRAEHHFAAAGDLRGDGKHQYRGKEGSRTAGDVDADLLNGA